MISGNLRYESLSGRILLAVLVTLFTLCDRPAYSASEPGTVTVVISTDLENLDPHDTAGTHIGKVLLANVVETLTEINPDDSSIMPRLATAWKQIDTNIWHFSLRKGVKFHDGKDFNAEAAVFNLRRLYDKRLPSQTRGKFFSHFHMEGKALDSHTLEVKTDKFEPLLPSLMGILAICSPGTPLDKITRNPIGTGPFKFSKWDAGIQIVLERFDGYWGKQTQVKKAVYVWRKESSVRAAMVEIGEADLALDIAKQDAKRPDMDYSYVNSETTLLHINVPEPPLNDRRVRLALNYAIDRNTIRGTILSKDVIPATQMVVPNVFGYNPDLKVWPYDPQKARQLLEEARKDGVPVDKPILLAGRTGQFSGDEELMEAVMTMYRAVGLNVTLKIMEPTIVRRYGVKPFPAGPFLMQRQHDNNKGDAVFTVLNFYHCNATQSHMCDKTVDDLIDKAQVATGEERKNLWRAAFKRIHDEIVPDVMLFHMMGYCRVGSRINFKPSVALSSQAELAPITFK
jgi:peptide/nickel transport system substrate-binding protein